MCINHVATVGFHRPAVFGFVPGALRHLRLEKRALVKAKAAADALRMLENLMPKGIFLFGHISGLLQQRKVDIGLDVALRAGIAIPVPSATEVSCALDDAEAFDAGFLKSSAHVEAAEAPAKHHHLDRLGNRFSLDARRVRIVVVVRELALGLLVLRLAIRPQAAVALEVVLRLHLLRVEA